MLEDRKEALAEIVPHGSAGMIRYSDHQQGHGDEFHRHACQYDLEGTIAKRRDKHYRPGRGADWLKIKCLNRDEFVIVGFTDPERSRQLSEILKSKGIPHRLELWGADVNHDWPWWRKMLPHVLGKIVG